MRIFTTLLITLSFPLLSMGQQTIYGSITYAGIQRDYILYVPEIYTSGDAVPLILNFHGYTSNAFEQLNYGDFRPIADTVGFLVVHPMGTSDLLGNPHWNVGWGSSTVDDVGFTTALIDSLSAMYTIDPEKIYSTGMSNGGFFSYKLACELSDRIAAIASVTGTMNIGQTGACNPSHPMPVMEIHGTADATVGYEGNFFFMSTPAVLAWWAAFNGCDATPVVQAIDDTDSGDGCTAEQQVYANGQNGSTVEHYKIIEGEHTWPGSAFGGVGTNQDIDASKEIWRFFSKYDIHGLINATALHDQGIASSVLVYPNPTGDMLTIECMDEGLNYTLTSVWGQSMDSGTLAQGSNSIDLSSIKPGMYILIAGENVVKIMKAL